MEKQEIRQMVEKQRAYFRTGATLKISTRIHALEKLSQCIQNHEKAIEEAIRLDLGKSGFESYM